VTFQEREHDADRSAGLAQRAPKGGARRRLRRWSIHAFGGGPDPEMIDAGWLV
jgi:hypothetical protein